MKKIIAASLVTLVMLFTFVTSTHSPATINKINMKNIVADPIDTGPIGTNVVTPAGIDMSSVRVL